MILKEEATSRKYWITLKEHSFVAARELEEDIERFISFYRVTQEGFKCFALLNKQDLSFA